MIRFQNSAASGYANPYRNLGSAMILFLAPMPGPGKSAHGQAVQEPSTEQREPQPHCRGTVRDSVARPIARRHFVYLRANDWDANSRPIRTGPDGAYRLLRALGEGVLHAAGGDGRDTSEAITFGSVRRRTRKRRSRVDLILKSAVLRTPPRQQHQPSRYNRSFSMSLNSRWRAA